MLSFISFRHSPTDRFLLPEWIAENKVPGPCLHPLPPVKRDYCVLPSLMVPQLFDFCVFKQPALMSRHQGHKTVNLLTALQIIAMTTSTVDKTQSGWNRNKANVCNVRSNEAVFPMRYGLQYGRYLFNEELLYQLGTNYSIIALVTLQLGSLLVGFIQQLMPWCHDSNAADTVHKSKVYMFLSVLLTSLLYTELKYKACLSATSAILL